MKEMAFSCT